MKSLFRYKTSAIGIVAGISIALLSLFYADYIQRLNELEQSEIEKFSYRYQACFSVMTNSETEYQLVSDTLQQFPITIMAENVSLYIDDEYAEHLCSVIISQNEKLNYHLSSGRYPRDAELEAGEPIAILGKALRNMVISKRDGEYIRICGEEYRVIGYCSGENTTITNYSILLFADCLGEQTQMDVWQAGNTYTQMYSLNSDILSPGDCYKVLSAELEAAGILVSPLTEYKSDFSGSQYRSNNKKLAYIVYIYSLILTLTVIQYWLYQRKYEIAVRRIYGYGKMKLYGYILKEFTGLLVLSVLVSLLLYGSIAFAYDWIYGIRLSGIHEAMLRFVILIGITMLILVSGTVWNTFRQSPLSAYRGIRK